MTKRMLADVLWEAANKWLPIEEFSCHAVAAATFGVNWREVDWEGSSSLTFLSQLGCDRSLSATSQGGWMWLNDELDSLERTEGTRYLWLLFAMHVAQDEGIEL